MKYLSHRQMSSRPADVRAFTLVEMLVAIAIFTTVVTTMVAVQVFGLRVYTLAATKLSATMGSRKAMNQIRDQIREAKTLNVGNCNSTPGSFNALGLTNYQVGNALEIFPTTNLNNYSLFYLNTTTATNCTLEQFTVSNGVTNSVALVGYITNQDIFTAQDYAGNTLTNDQVMANRMVIYLKLQFWQWEYPIAFVGTNALNAYDYYQLRTRITRRAFD
jgi:prepilin-type N-terminal cleavage/methylation domain-containing protein